MRMRLLLLGGGNLLAQSLVQQGALEDIVFHMPKPSELGWDVKNLEHLLEEIKPDCVINLAYYFDWFQAREVDAEKLAIQIATVEMLAKLCHDRAIILFQPSSYRVFGGTKVTAYSEEEEPFSISVLGQALWQMEQSVQAVCKRHILLRFGWLLDASLEGRIGRLIKRAETLPEICLADDRRGNPTPVDDAARVILGILQQLDCDTDLWGIYHYGGMEATTSLAWGQIALEEARNYQANLTNQVIAQAHASFPDAIVEPQHAVLACKKILYTFGIKPRAWRAAIPSLFKCFYQYKSRDECP